MHQLLQSHAVTALQRKQKTTFLNLLLSNMECDYNSLLTFAD